jgi:hypothetical protein
LKHTINLDPAPVLNVTAIPTAEIGAVVGRDCDALEGEANRRARAAQSAHSAGKLDGAVGQARLYDAVNRGTDSNRRFTLGERQVW